MADGQLMHADSKTPSGPTFSLDEAIARLESGSQEDMIVDLGNGRTARAEGARGPSGLLQRLRGHRMLVALANGTADVPCFQPADTVSVSPQVKEILDAAIVKR